MADATPVSSPSRRSTTAHSRQASELAILEASLDGMALLGADGRINDINSAALAMLDRSRVEAVGRVLTGLILPPRQRAAIEAMLLRDLAAGQGALLGRRLELSGQRGDGSEFPLEMSLVRLATPGLPWFLAQLRDVSESRRTEEALRASEARYRTIFENAVEGFFQTTPDGRFLTLNPALARMYGLASPQEVIAHFQDIAGQLYVDARRRQEFQRIMDAEGVVTGFEFEIHRVDGSRAWVSESARAVRDQAGKLLYYEGTVEDITERKQADLELKRSQARYYSLIENLPISLFCKDRESRFTYANERFCELLGKSLDEIIGKTDFDFFPGPLAEAYRTDDRRVMTADVTLEREEVNQAPGSDHRFVHVIKAPVHDVHGQVNGLQCIFWDVTERQRAEAALRESTQRLREAQAISRLGSFYWDVAKNQVAWTDELYRIYGLAPAADITLQSYLQHVHPEHREQVQAMVQSALRQGSSVEHEYQIVRSDGEVRWVQARLARIVDAQGEVTALQGTCQDITERKRAEQELRERQTFLEMSQQTGHVGSWVWDMTTQAVQWSAEMFRIYGLAPDQFDGTLAGAIRAIHPDDQAKVQQSTQELLAVEQPAPLEFRILRPDGEVRTAWGRGEIFRDASGKPVRMIGTVMDITERKQAEEERRRLEAQIQQAQKAASLEVLAGGIAHDFNNLLTAVLGYAGLAQAHLPADSPAGPMLGEIEKAARRAADLTQQMLAYSGRGKFVVQFIRLDSVVREMTKLLEAVVSKKAELKLELMPAVVEADATQIRQVVMNLITNASDALEGRPGSITIRTGVIQAEASALRSQYIAEELPAGAYALFEVADTGCGMTEETLPRIFDPFFTTKFTGRGLGLAAVLGIVKGHHGAVQVASTAGQGTVFRILLPAATMSPHEPPSAAAPAAAPLQGRGVVLVVEDEPSLRTFACRVLESAGFETVAASDGRDGLDLLLRRHGDIVAVLLDLTMPRMDGLEVLRELRGAHPAMPVLVMSGFSEQEVARRLAGAGAYGFLPKPFQPDELIARIFQLLPSQQ